MLVYDKPLFVQMLVESFARAQSFPVTVTKKKDAPCGAPLLSMR